MLQSKIPGLGSGYPGQWGGVRGCGGSYSSLPRPSLEPSATFTAITCLPTGLRLLNTGSGQSSLISVPPVPGTRQPRPEKPEFLHSPALITTEHRKCNAFVKNGQTGNFQAVALVCAGTTCSHRSSGAPASALIVVQNCAILRSLYRQADIIFPVFSASTLTPDPCRLGSHRDLRGMNPKVDPNPLQPRQLPGPGGAPALHADPRLSSPCQVSL